MLGFAPDDLPRLRRVGERHLLADVVTDWARFPAERPRRGRRPAARGPRTRACTSLADLVEGQWARLRGDARGHRARRRDDRAASGRPRARRRRRGRGGVVRATGVSTVRRPSRSASTATLDARRRSVGQPRRDRGGAPATSPRCSRWTVIRCARCTPRPQSSTTSCRGDRGGGAAAPRDSTMQLSFGGARTKSPGGGSTEERLRAVQGFAGAVPAQAARTCEALRRRCPPAPPRFRARGAGGPLFVPGSPRAAAPPSLCAEAASPRPPRGGAVRRRLHRRRRIRRRPLHRDLLASAGAIPHRSTSARSESGVAATALRG